MDMPAPLPGFIIYSREDEEHLTLLLKHLQPLVDKRLLEPWTDRCLIAGDRWESILLERLHSAPLILMLVSADLNASKFVQETELKVSLEREARGECRIIPILARPTHVKDTPLDRFQWLPKDRRPVTEWANRDAAWVNVVEEVEALLKRGRAGAGAKGVVPPLPGVSGSETRLRSEEKPLSPKSSLPAGPVNLNALHFSDLHVGLGPSKWLWPNVRKELLSDLSRLSDRIGPIHLILFTGDLVQSGSAEEYLALDTELNRIFTHIYNLQGFEPLLLTVPGNHDLVRPEDEHDPEALTLRQCHGAGAIPGLRDRLYGGNDIRKTTASKPTAPRQRDAIKRAFDAYGEWSMRWHKAHPPDPRFSVSWSTDGVMPGDFGASIHCQGLKLGVVGLNSAALQLLGGAYEGLLDLDPRQIAAVCGEQYTDWFDAHDACLLLTHHPPQWLHPEARTRLTQEIAPAGRFLAHLYGHMHTHDARLTQVGGNQPRRSWQGASLFGLEHWGERLEAASNRSHGYTAFRIALHPEGGHVLLWPRIGKQLEGGWKVLPDVEQNLDEHGAITLEVKERLKSPPVEKDDEAESDDDSPASPRDRGQRVWTHLDRTFQWNEFLAAIAKGVSAVFVLFGHRRQRPHHMLERLPDMLTEQCRISHQLVKFSKPSSRGWPDAVDQWERLFLTALRGSGVSAQGSLDTQLQQAASKQALLLYNQMEFNVLTPQQRSSLAEFLVERLVPHLNTAKCPIRVLLTIKYDGLHEPDGLVREHKAKYSGEVSHIPVLVDDWEKAESAAMLKPDYQSRSGNGMHIRHHSATHTGSDLQVLPEMTGPRWQDVDAYLKDYYGARYRLLSDDTREALEKACYDLTLTHTGEKCDPSYYDVCDVLTKFIEREF